jgi:hypothetical protein
MYGGFLVVNEEVYYLPEEQGIHPVAEASPYG